MKKEENKNQKIQLEKSTDSGQLVVDVYETEKEVVVRSAIAGVTAEELNISLEQDILIIKGERKDKEEVPKDKRNYFIQECYFGPFEKEIILPKEVETTEIKAKMKNGFLIIRLPKGKNNSKKIEIK
ncbi:MAG: Hsp20/alpha crystallin family protein [Candidatus Pacebacteria bacterium]|nr:Hsp20/alpha crystallin family protein [Candidatus Paceibacterota bacterium]MDD3048263.1 Hsp20/alpha crystallin family protein [Candidatus Paceibacterota bacterium]MDD3510081.1 Hsp20/alpha crystallin family protein [Candidatus Paceibacterota bacterium]MDD3918825.1 Hsp20/alpha crystallin family protein [Candidatus Paceibacterota bacterium]